MKGFNAISGHTFDEPYITYHRLRAEAGDYDSARWLRDNVRAALKAGHHIHPYLLYLVEQMRKGGLREWVRSKGHKGHGKRGAGLGDSNQLTLAVETWKQIKLARRTVRKAADYAANRLNLTSSSAINAYYRFANSEVERRVFFYELSRDYIDSPDAWRNLAANQDAFDKTLKILEEMKRAVNSKT